MKKSFFKHNSVKWGNIYDKEGNLIRRIDGKTGMVKPYSLEELEELCSTLKPGTPLYKNATSMLIQWYQNPRTKEDAEYVRKKQAELLEKLQQQAKENNKKSPESVNAALKEVSEQLDNQIQDAGFEEIKDK